MSLLTYVCTNVFQESDAIVKQEEEMVRISGISSPKNADEEACNLSVGQV